MQIKSQYEYKGRIYKVTYHDGVPQDIVIGGGVHCYCFYNDKLVLVGYSNSDSWTPPGGAIEKGETYEEAAIREIKEESNMKVLWMECIGHQDVEVVSDKNIRERQYRMVCMVEPYGDFESDPDADISEIKLIDPKDYKKYIKWGEIGDHLMKQALDMKEKYLNNMNNFYLSYLMGSKNITDYNITALGISIEEKDQDGDRSLKIPEEKLPQYIELIKTKLDEGFWNEIIGSKEIIFIFKMKDGSIKEYKLSPNNEKEIGKLCSEFNGDSEEKTANVYKYISGNSFYHDFMLEHYADMINRK